MQSTLLQSEDTTKSMLLYSADDLFRYACKAKFEKLYNINSISSTSALQTLIDNNRYDVSIFDILYIGQCDNLIRYLRLHNVNTRIIVVVTTWEQERYYVGRQHILGITKVFKKPLVSEQYHFIINEIV